MSGALTKAMAMLVSGPKVQSVMVARRRGANRIDKIIDAVLRLQRHFRVWKHGAVKACLAMDMLGGDQGARHRADAAGIDGHVGAPGEFANLARVLFGQPQRHIAGNGNDGLNVEIVLRAECQQNGHSIVLPRIGIDNDLRAMRGSPRNGVMGSGLASPVPSGQGEDAVVPLPAFR